MWENIGKEEKESSEDEGCGCGCFATVLLIVGLVVVIAWWMGWLGVWWDTAREWICEVVCNGTVG